MATTTTHTQYGSPISVEAQRAASSKIRKRSGFAYPLIGKLFQATGSPASLHSSVNQGGYFSKSYGLDLIRNNIRQLFLCEQGERIMLPSYGLALRKYLFEPMDETTFYLLKNDILITLEKYFSSVRVLNIRVFPSLVEQEQHQLHVYLTLQMKDTSLEIFDTEVTIR